MASRTQWTYVDTVEKAEEALLKLKNNSTLYVDGEGVDLGRTGQLCLLQVAIEDHVYLFDIVSLGHTVFDMGLRGILEDPAVKIVMFDCKEDCNALLHQFNTRVEGIEDLQIVNFVVREIEEPRPVVHVTGLKKCMERYLPGCGFGVREKEAMHRAMDNDKTLWRQRPLPENFLAYAANDVSHLPQLRRKLYGSHFTSESVKTIVQRSSQRYANFSRDSPLYKSGCPYSARRAKLPENIVPSKQDLRRGISEVRNEGEHCMKCYQLTTRPNRVCHTCVLIEQQITFGRRF